PCPTGRDFDGLSLLCFDHRRNGRAGRDSRACPGIPSAGQSYGKEKPPARGIRDFHTGRCKPYRADERRSSDRQRFDQGITERIRQASRSSPKVHQITKARARLNSRSVRPHGTRRRSVPPAGSRGPLKPVAIHIGLRRVVDDSYDILIGIPLARAIEDIVRISGGGKAFVITDTNVARRYARAVDRRLRVRGERCKIPLVPPGEKSQSRGIKARLENFLLSAGAGRDSMII